MQEKIQMEHLSLLAEVSAESGALHNRDDMAAPKTVS
jgi:hypothetical protein